MMMCMWMLKEVDVERSGCVCECVCVGGCACGCRC